MADPKDNKKEEDLRVQDAIRKLAETEEGAVFFNWLMKTCYFHNSTIVADPQRHEVNTLGTIFNESRRRVYLDIRRAIPKAIRRKIENT
jgi:hypothetical protein